MAYKQLFWLHIKKSAGITTRSLLQPYYTEVDRLNKPRTFIQAQPEEYNDVLNNYRVPLGDYQFKRCLFAREYLYPGRWEDMFSFAFARDPTDRCVSMFYYLFWEETSCLRNMARYLRRCVNREKAIFSTSYAFDVFLDSISEAQSSESVYQPINNVVMKHVETSVFTTHVATVWDDITDLSGNIIIKQMYRLDNLNEAINAVFEECGIDKRVENKNTQLNKNTRRKLYVPNKHQMAKIEKVYGKDFEVYENAWHI